MNKLWKIFLTGIAVITVVYTFPTVFLWADFFRTSQPSKTAAVSWSIAILPKERFAPAAHFSYLANGQPQRGFSVLDHYSSRRLGEVEALGPTLWGKKWKAWVQPQNPKNVVFDKVFPWKRTIYTGILWVLLIYFFSLGYYVKKRV